MAKLMKCKACALYSLSEKCSQCDAATSQAHPPKYSKEDKYATYRRKEKFEQRL